MTEATKKQRLNCADRFADYMMDSLAPDLVEIHMPCTADDVIEAATTIKMLLRYLKEGDK